MKIAFVGKGGSGKTALTALYVQYLRYNRNFVLAIDADINMHLGPLLGYTELLNPRLHISNPENSKHIKTILKGKNTLIKDLSHFRKSTPPGTGSHLIHLEDESDPILSAFTIGSLGSSLMTVGSYGTEGIGVSCYHNNLSILENILSHTLDNNGTIAVDMVAGTDAFASTLHAQFDLLILSVEPTKRGIEVFNQYYQLAEQAAVLDRLRVVGNKLRSTKDLEFIRTHIPESLFLGALCESTHLREIEQTGEPIQIDKLEPEITLLMSTLSSELHSHQVSATKKLHHLQELHRKYVSQDFISERFGELSTQIDPTFSLN